MFVVGQEILIYSDEGVLEVAQVTAEVAEKGTTRMTRSG
jgi:hypothetical protein